MTLTANREYKDTVFKMVFSKKEDLLSLYNAVNETHYTNVDDLEVNTLENAIYMGMKNDLSFIFDSSLNIYEHQSTDNPNMPLRDLFYVATLYEKMVGKKTIYASSRIKIPMPRFIVFYNGKDKCLPEVSEYRLSELYEIPESFKKNNTFEEYDYDLEPRVKVLNINTKMSYNIKKQCKKLREYCLYVEKVRELSKLKNITEAVNEAIDYCIENDILRELLISQRAEVEHMSIFEYNEAEEKQKLRDAEREAGREAGREARNIEIITNMISLGVCIEEIAKLVDIPLKDVEKYIRECIDK